MSQTPLKIYMFKGNNLQLFFRKFALIKILATQTDVVESQDSFLLFNFSGKTPSSLGMTNHLIGSAGFNNKITAEVKIMSERFTQFCVRETVKNPIEAIDKIQLWLDRHLQHCRKFFLTYSSFADDLNEINRKMNAALGFGICAGSVAQASAELALILTGVGLPAGRLVRFVPATIKEIGLRAILGFEIGYSVSVIEEWGSAGKADIMALDLKEGDAFNGVGMQTGGAGDLIKDIAIERNNAEIARIANSSPHALTRHAKVKANANVNQRQMPVKIQQTQLKGAGQALMGLNYLLSVKATYETLEKCVKHCSYEL